jgi:hypothetical protein
MIRGWGKCQLAYAEIDSSSEDQLTHATNWLEIMPWIHQPSVIFRVQGTTSGTFETRNGLESRNSSPSYALREMVLRHESNANRKETPFISLTSNEAVARKWGHTKTWWDRRVKLLTIDTTRMDEKSFAPMSDCYEEAELKPKFSNREEWWVKGGIPKDAVVRREILNISERNSLLV